MQVGSSSGTKTAVAFHLCLRNLHSIESFHEYFPRKTAVIIYLLRLQPVTSDFKGLCVNYDISIFLSILKRTKLCLCTNNSLLKNKPEKS